MGLKTKLFLVIFSILGIYNISAQDIVTLLNYAGYYCGVGMWRPKGRDGGSGTFGMYEVKIK